MRFHRRFLHKVRTIKFPYHEALLDFVKDNKEMELFLKVDPTVAPFKKMGNQILVDIDSYIKFCKDIQTKTRDRAPAFFGQHIRSENILDSEQRKDVVLLTDKEDKLVDILKVLPLESQQKITDALVTTKGVTMPYVYSAQNFINGLPQAFTSPQARAVIISRFPEVQLVTLKEHRNFLQKNLNQNETFIQNWIDGKTDNFGNIIKNSKDEVQKIKKSRCLIFGLEFINHKREGTTSQKRFDILTRISEGRNEYVLIELKSPSGKVFEVKKSVNSNEGETSTYSLSSEVARAIPQITHYKGLLKTATSTDWQRYGLEKGEVVKSIILVGTREENDKIWDEHYTDLRHGLSSAIEVMTYTDLLDKLNATIKNLEENL
jgi:hypothetical protein